MTSRDWAHNRSLKYMPKEDRFFLELPEARYAFGVIGAGVIGQEHIRCTHFEGRARIAGVYDPNKGSIEAAKREHAEYTEAPLRIYTSLEEAFGDSEADAFIIATPNHTHLDVLRLGIQSGKPILLEKPMAHTLEDAYEILRIAENYDAPLQVGLQYRCKSMYREALYETLERRSLGDVKLIYICEHRIPFLDKVGQWNKFSNRSGGTLIEKCCHYFDLFNLIARDRPARVFASGGQAVNFTNFRYRGESSDILDNAAVIVEYPNGVRGNFNLCMFAPQFYEELSICGDSGRLRCFEKQDFPGGEETEVYLEILRGELEPARKMTTRYPRSVERLGHHGSTLIEHARFVDTVERGDLGPSASAREGFWSVVVGAAAEESAGSGEPVVIDEMLERHGTAV